MHIYRSHTCGALRASDVGQTIRLSGWVHRKRDHGGISFINLRDRYGITQVVVDSDAAPGLAADRADPGGGGADRAGPRLVPGLAAGGGAGFRGRCAQGPDRTGDLTRRCRAR